MFNYNIPFILLHISVLLILIMFIYIIRIKNKRQLHYSFLGMIACLLIWSIGSITIQYINMIFDYYSIFIHYLIYIGVCIIPVTIFLTGIIFAHTRINFNWKYKSLFVIPFISLILVFTNDYHHLFFENITPKLEVFGKYFIIHATYSYGLIFIGLFYLVSFSIKNSGFFSKQAFLIMIGILVPLAWDILFTFHIVYLPFYYEVIGFSFAIICFAFAILKFDFLNLAPIALQKIVDLMSDSYIVINENYEIIDYNKAFINTFKDFLIVKRRDNLIDLFKTYLPNFVDKNKLIELNNLAIKNKKSVNYQKHVNLENYDKHFNIEIIPIFSRKNYIGTVILFKDITEHKRHIETIRREYEQLKLYTGIIEELSKDIRKHKHDFNNILLALRGFIDNNDIEGIKKYFYNSILEEQKNMNNSNTIYLQLQNISDLALKGLLTTKINNALSLNLDISLSIINSIDHIPVDTIDLCKIIGILMDNAIEASKESDEKVLSIAMMKDEDVINFIIGNTFRDRPDMQKIYEEGFSTKGENRGLGLNILKKIICDKYNNIIQLKTDIDGKFFIQELIFCDIKNSQKFKVS